MKVLAHLFALSFLCSFLLGMPYRDLSGVTFPDRPALVYASYQGKNLTVAAVDGERPMVKVGGKLVKADKQIPVFLYPEKEYGAGSVKMTGHDMTIYYAFMETRDRASDRKQFEQVPQYTWFEADFESETNLRNAFIVILVFDAKKSDDGPPKFGTLIKELPDLEAREKQHVKLRLPPIRMGPTWLWTPLIFSEGKQIKMSPPPLALAQYFDANERSSFKTALDKRGDGPDTGVAVFRMHKVEIQEPLKSKYTGQKLTLLLDYDQQGKLYQIDIRDNTDVALHQAVCAEVLNWLILPPVRNGQLKPSQMQIELAP